MASDKRLLTIEEAAKELRISRQSLYNLVNNKQLQVVKIGKRTFIDNQDLEQFIQDQKTSAPLEELPVHRIRRSKKPLEESSVPSKKRIRKKP
jgi:excisionase family DNA binding protein